MKKGIISREILEKVWKALSDKDEAVSEYINSNESDIGDTLNTMKQDAIDIMLKIRTTKGDNISIDEIINRTAPAFFAAGLLSEKLARDIVDTKDVPSLKDFIKDYISSEFEDKVSNAVSKRRSTSKS